MLERVIEKRPAADRILIAEIWGEARRRARWRELSSDQESAALAELRSLAGGRADLLAEVAGVLEGVSEGELDEPLAGRPRPCAAGPGPTRRRYRRGPSKGSAAGRMPAVRRSRPPGAAAWKDHHHDPDPGYERCGSRSAPADRRVRAWSLRRGTGSRARRQPASTATALGLLASPAAVTVRCTACGAPVQAGHDPVAAIRPGLHLVSEQPQP